MSPPAANSDPVIREPAIAVALGGGGARGLAHLGVLEVLEKEGIRPGFIAGTSIGGLIGALWATALPAEEIIRAARRFRLPARFMPGRVLVWDRIFASAVPILEGRTFQSLATPLVVSAVDLLTGEEVALTSGPVLPAVRATCAIPGALDPERIGDHCLMDGGVTNILPVDLAWSCDPHVVIAVNILAGPAPALKLDSAYCRAATRLGRIAPNPLTAYYSYGIAMRAVEIALNRQRAMAVAMTGPEVLVDVDLGDVLVSDFHRLDEVLEIGRRATQDAMPRIKATLAETAQSGARPREAMSLHIDPVCRMSVSSSRARARAERDGIAYYFCSTNCRDVFERYGDRYLPARGTRNPPGRA
jgi:NTE family protein